MSKFQLLTKNGYCCYETLSALQKNLRRGIVKDSIYRAFEMLPGNGHKGYEVWLWKRLCICILEDCDWNDAIPQINSLREMYFFLKKSGTESSEGLLCVCRAVEIICRAWKGRDTTFRCLLNDTMPKLEIPEYALDPHTYRGKLKRKKEGKSRKDWVIEQQNSLEPTSKPTKTLYHEILDNIDEIMAKRKNKEETKPGLFDEGTVCNN